MTSIARMFLARFRVLAWLVGEDRQQNRIEHKIDAALEHLIEARKEIATMSPKIQKLTQEVAEMKEVNTSAITLITGLAQQIRESKDDADALDKLAGDLDAQAKSLAAAVTANTPAADTEPPAPAPAPAPADNG